MSGVPEVNQTEVNKVQKRKLPFGHYKTSFKTSDSEEVICKPLNQDEISEGWIQVLPNKQRSPVYHWSVTLSQLPPHLWDKYKVGYNEGKKYYPIIKDGIYNYSVNQTKHDETLIKLYKELTKGYHADLSVIKTYLSELDNVNGWLVTRAKKFLKQSKFDRYFDDLIDLSSLDNNLFIDKI